MSTNFPTSLDALTNPSSGDALNSPSHADQHANANDAIEALEAKVGVDSSAVNTSHDYKLGGVATGDRAVSLTGTETLTNKTLTSPVINLGSNATGDIYYRDGSGVFQRLAIGSTSQILNVDASGVPAWISNPSASSASTTTAGIVELATTAETTTGTDATRAVTPDGLHDMTSLAGAAWFLDEDTMSSDSDTKVASQQSIKAYVDGIRVFKNGTTTYDASTASGNQTIAHGAGKTPKVVRLRIRAFESSGAYSTDGYGVYNGTTFSCISNCPAITGGGATYVGTSIAVYSGANTGQTASGVTVDATNITIAWTKEGSPTGNIDIVWEVEA